MWWGRGGRVAGVVAVLPVDDGLGDVGDLLTAGHRRLSHRHHLLPVHLQADGAVQAGQQGHGLVVAGVGHVHLVDLRRERRMKEYLVGGNAHILLE